MAWFAEQDSSNLFFFQAEDGIRAHCVTRVQTCALPILARETAHERGPQRRPDEAGDDAAARTALESAEVVRHLDPVLVGRQLGCDLRIDDRPAEDIEEEIGRASCRERVWFSGVARSRRR